MFQVPTTESKERSQAVRTAPKPEPQRELHPHSHAGAYARAASPGAARHRLYSAGLQRTIGNQAVLRLMNNSRSAIQTKLVVNEPGDSFEQEADRVAEQVMSATPVTVIQRICSSCKDEDKVQRKCTGCEEEETGTQRKETHPGPLLAPPSVHDVLNSPGEPLDPAARAFMESRFGQDFGTVRVHADERASQSAKAVGALAYTNRNNIVFDAANYNLPSAASRRLLAHELTHVIQQRSGSHMIQRYEESTEANTKLGQTAKAASQILLPPVGIYAAYCLSQLEQPMIDITFNRWIADACGRKAYHLMHSREWDAFGHCWIGCEGSRKCGTGATRVAGTIREFYREAQRILKTRPHDSYTQDVANQAVGRALAYTAGTCYSLCDTAHSGGTLDLSAPVADCVDCSLAPVTCPPTPTPTVALPAAPVPPPVSTGQASPPPSPSPHDAGAPHVGAFDSEEQ